MSRSFVHVGDLSRADVAQLGTNVVDAVLTESTRRPGRRRSGAHLALLAAVNRSLALHGESIDRFCRRSRPA